MTNIAIINIMATSERKERMGKVGAGPCKTVYHMTFIAISRKLACNMVRACGSHIIFLVAVITFHAERLKTQQGFGRVAGIAIGSHMRPDKRKTAKLMDLCNILDNPGFWRMAPSAFKSNSLVMNISMARHTVGLCLRKNK